MSKQKTETCYKLLKIIKLIEKTDYPENVMSPFMGFFEKVMSPFMGFFKNVMSPFMG